MNATTARPLAQSLLSDIDYYFNSPRVSVTDATNPNWLCNWWSSHKDEMPQMAAAARYYLAIPVSELQKWLLRGYLMQRSIF
jgi:hypothetical protein